MVLKLSCLFPARRHPAEPTDHRPTDFLSPLLIPKAASPEPVRRSPVRQKRSSLTSFFAFSSKRRSAQLLAPPTPVPGRWVSDRVNPSSIPSPLRADDEDYYYAYYPNSPSPRPDRPTDSQQSSPVQLRHPFALRHATSQPFHPAHPTVAPAVVQPQLKSSVSSPDLAARARPRSVLRKRPRGQERWLSAESWWDAVFSPSPRFKVKQAPRSPPPHPNPPTFPAARPRAASAASVAVRPMHSVLARSRSVADLGQPSTSAAPFEPALETLPDEPAPTPDPAPEISLPDPPLSLDQVIDDGEAFEQQRAQWKHQASKSIGNKHTRSFSRARSKSLGEKQVPGHRPSETLEFLAARTLLGSQSTMPTVHVTKPSNSSSHSKSYSHSHTQSAYSHSHTSNSHAHSHSHSHSLTTSNSSKSSRNLLPRSHSRNESWSKTALWKAGVFCGITQDESFSADEKAPPSTRADGDGEVGIAITSSPHSDGGFNLDVPARHHQPHRRVSQRTHKSSDYAGPHPSAIDSTLPQLAAASNVSLRHRLPPRAAIHPPIAPIPHPYRSTPIQSACDKASDGTALKLPDGLETTEPRTFHPHISLSQPDFERYGVGEALVYASLPRPADAKPDLEPSVAESSPPEEHASLRETEPNSSSLALNGPPSMTSSTIQMVMSAFENPDDLDEFQDLFYKPHLVHADQVPTDIHSSSSGSPLTHLVRKLSEDVHGRRGASRTPSDQTSPMQWSDSQDQPSHEGGSAGTKFVFLDLSRSASPPPMESGSQLQLPIRKESDPASQPVMVIPEDVNSSYTASVMEDTSLSSAENDTFGYPVKREQFEAATSSPTPVQSPNRRSTHLSIRDADADSDLDPNPDTNTDPDADADADADADTTTQSPTKRYGVCMPNLDALDVVRASYLTTTSDVSHMSGLSDFPLPPSARPQHGPDPTAILQAYFEATPPPSERRSFSFDEGEGGEGEDREDGESESESVGSDEDETVELGDPQTNDGDDEGEGDVRETLRVLRTTGRVTSYESHRTTFGGSDDMDFITQLHQARA